MKLLSFGEVLWDVYPDSQVIGGAPLNFAAHTAAHGSNVAMLSAVGADELGDRALEQLNRWGVDVSLVARSDKATGTCMVTLDEQQVPTYSLTPDVAWDDIPTEVSDLGEYDAIYFGTLALRGAVNRQRIAALLGSASFKDVFVDINIRAPFYTPETVAFAMSCATILKISDEEWPIVREAVGLSSDLENEAALKALADAYPKLRVIILTKGKDGAAAYERAVDRVWSVDAVQTPVVSTVGAGDSFSAAFYSTFAATGDIKAALSHASRVAALVVSRVEAVPVYDPNTL